MVRSLCCSCNQRCCIDGCGAGIALLSFLLGSPRLFLLGLSFEIGEGVQHALQIAHARAWPARATAPFHSADAMALAPYILLHHSLGLLGGCRAMIWAPKNPKNSMWCEPLSSPHLSSPPHCPAALPALPQR